MAQADEDGYVPGSPNQTDVDEEEQGIAEQEQEEVPNVDQVEMEDEGIDADDWQPSAVVQVVQAPFYCTVQ